MALDRTVKVEEFLQLLKGFPSLEELDFLKITQNKELAFDNSIRGRTILWMFFFFIFFFHLYIVKCWVAAIL